MERRMNQKLLDILTEEQLLKLVSSDYGEEFLTELRKRGNNLSYDIFVLAFPDCEKVITEKSYRGFETVDGEFLIPIYQLVAVDEDGNEVRSQGFI